MPTLDYQKSNGDKWPLAGTYAGVPLEFSGSFDPARVAREQAEQAIAVTVRNVAWIIASLGAAAFIYSGYEFAYLDGNYFFIFQRHWANLIGWIGTISALYLWAERLHWAAQRASNRTLSQATLQTWQASGQTIDVYRLFTDNAKAAWDKAATHGGKIGPAQMLDALLTDKSVQLAFLRFGISPDQIATQFRQLGEPTSDDEAVIARLPFAAIDEAMRLKNRFIDPVILLAALVRELPDSHPISKIFFALDFGTEQLETIASWIFNLEILVEDDKLIHRIASHRSDKGVNRALTAVPTPYLNQFSRDLTLAAKYHQLALTRGREADTETVIKLLGQKRNVMILGNKGTGRRTVIHDLAYRMVGEQVPAAIQDKRLVELELAGILGSKTPPEQVIVNLFSEAEHSGNLLFALPDAHELAKATGAEGLPILEIFLSHLANSSVQVVITATPESFQTHLRNIPRIGELFATHELSELDREGIIIAAAVRASSLEAAHGVFFQYQAIDEAVKLTDTISTQDAGQPEKTIEILQAAAMAAKGLPQNERMITPLSIQKIVAEKSHVPVESLTEPESEKLLHIEDELTKYIIGQQDAVKAVSEALRRARSGLVSGTRPLASFLFVGPTGVGKTEMARTLAKVYFGKPEYMLRLDMSEYQGTDGMRKLLGESAQTADTPFVVHLKTYPFCLFLLDELEKASDSVLNLFLQVLEDGRITTAAGQTLDLTHTIIIATSNAGTKDIQEGIKNGETLAAIKQRLLETILIQHYRPEFLNRFDGIILFSPLHPEEVRQITKLQLQLVADKLLEQKIRISFSDAVVAKIATDAFDALLGARPVRRYIQDNVEGVIAKALLSSQLVKGSEATIDLTEAGEFMIK